MSETYDFGPSQKAERLEYRTLSEQDLGMYIAMASERLESFLLQVRPSHDIGIAFHKDEEKFYKSFDMQYLTTASDPEITFVYDEDNGDLAQYEPPIVPIINTLHVSHTRYVHSALSEEYIVNIDRNDAGTKRAFASRYHFIRGMSDNWLATVQHTDIDAVSEDDYGKYYTRDMTPYDFDEFFKDANEIHDQLRLRLVQ